MWPWCSTSRRHHLSWHGSLEAYAAAKWKVLANLGASGGVAVLDACDDAVRAKIRELRARGGVPFRYIPIGGACRSRRRHARHLRR